MQSSKISSGRLIKVDAGWTAGMNTIRHPWLLREDQYRRGLNIVNRGGVAQTRPGFGMRLIAPAGNLQGFEVFKVTKDDQDKDFMVIAVDGVVYALPFPLQQPRDWNEFKLRNIQFDPLAPYIFFCAAEKSVTTLVDSSLQIVPTYNVLMMQDGKSEAAFWDGAENRHLSEGRPNLETPRGTWMAYSGDRLWVARGKIMIASDLRDPLKFVERTQGEGRGDFSFKKPVSGLTSFIGDNSNEVLVVFTENRCEILQSGIRDRTKWAATTNFQSILFPSTGCIAGRSIIFQAGLMWWYSEGGLVSSDIAASTKLTSQMNFKDAEMAFSKQFLGDDLSGICGLSFENYVLMSLPVGQMLNGETFVLDYSPMSEFSADKIPAWSSVWTGIRPIQWVSAKIGSRARAFAASIDYKALSDGSYNHIWEAFLPQRKDTFFDLDADFTSTEFSQPIYCEFETRMLGDGLDLKKFVYADMGLIEINGDVSFNVAYKGSRGSYKEILCKKILAPTQIDESGVKLTDKQIEDLGLLRKQSRRLVTEETKTGVGCELCENKHTEEIDNYFCLLLSWCGEVAVQNVRLFMDAFPESSTGTVEKNETKVCIVDEDGRNHIYDREKGFIPVEDLFVVSEATVWLATTTYTATSTCPDGSITGVITVTAQASYRSRISQEDADNQAALAAQQAAQNQLAYQRSQLPCQWLAQKQFTKLCYAQLEDQVETIAFLDVADPKLVLGGVFVFDRATAQDRFTLRDYPNGVRDLSVDGLGFNDETKKILVDLSNNILVGGIFTTTAGNPPPLAGTDRRFLTRLLSDGSFDPAFSAFFDTTNIGGVYALAELPGGEYFVGGLFDDYANTAVKRLIKIDATGAHVPGFVAGGLPADHVVCDIIIIDGTYMAYCSTNESGSAGRLDVLEIATGNQSGTFSPVTWSAGAMADCRIALQNGKIILIGEGVDGGVRIARIDMDGNVDSTFIVGTGFVDGVPLSVFVDPDDKVYVGGAFTDYDGNAADRIIRLNVDGDVDSSFDSASGADNAVHAIFVKDGNVYIGGSFTSYGGQDAFRFARLTDTGLLMPSYQFTTQFASAISTVDQADADASAEAQAEALAEAALPCT